MRGSLSWASALLAVHAGCARVDVVGEWIGGSGGGDGGVVTSAGTGDPWGADGPESTGSGGGSSSGAGVTTGATSASSDSGGAGSTAGSTGGATGGSTGAPAGCGKLDLLFVLDTGLGEDAANFARLQEGTAPLLAALWSTLPAGLDVHVGVTLSDFSPATSCQQDVVSCVIQQSEAEIAGHYLPPDQGTTDEDGGQGRLRSYQGTNWASAVVGEDPSPVIGWLGGMMGELVPFDCPMSMPGAALGWVLDPATAEANAGFARSDALLFVVVVTRGPDATPVAPPELAARLLSAKGQCTNCVQVAALLGPCAQFADQPLWPLLHELDADPLVGAIGDDDVWTSFLGAGIAEDAAQGCAQVDP